MEWRETASFSSSDEDGDESTKTIGDDKKSSFSSIYAAGLIMLKESIRMRANHHHRPSVINYETTTVEK